MSIGKSSLLFLLATLRQNCPAGNDAGLRRNVLKFLVSGPAAGNNRTGYSRQARLTPRRGANPEPGRVRPRLFLVLVLKMRQAQTFLATIENDHQAMKTLAVISILALLTISGAAYTDQLLTSDQQTTLRAN